MKSAPLLVLLVCCACVERRMFVRTEPPGALVRVNGREIGTSPVVWPFDHYGKVRVEAELAGREPTEKIVELKAPTREWLGGGLFTDLLWPGTIYDDHDVTIRLPAVKRRSDAALEAELERLQQRATRTRAEAAKAAQP